MSPAIVGNDGYEFVKIAGVMLGSATGKEIVNNWTDLAASLEIRQQVHRLERQMSLSAISDLELIIQLLETWRSTKSDGATFNKLHDVLHDTLKWTNVADDLMKEFCHVIPDKTVWKDLHVRTQTSLMNLMVNFQGTSLPILELLAKLEIDIEAFFEYLDTNSIREMIKAKSTVKLTHLMGPSIPQNYIERKFTCNNQVNPAVFQSSTNDKFVIQGMSLVELASLAGNEFLEDSYPHKQTYKSRFIRLVRLADFEHIREVTVNEPVHLIMYEDNKHRWVFSNGSTRTIRDHLMCNTDSYIYTEQDFIRKMDEDTFVNATVIADYPGMGKSLALAHLFSATQQEGYLNIFIAMPALVSITPSSVLSVAEVVPAIVELVACSNLGKKIFSFALTSSGSKKQIFIDAFDEVSPEKLDVARSCLKLLNQQINTRLFVATRLHKVQHLQHDLNVIPYNLIPLQRSEQEELIVKQWIDTLTGELPNDKVELFANDICVLFELANKVIAKSFQKGASKEIEFAGFPLQCKMLAEIYLEDAKTCMKMNSIPSVIEVKPYSIFDLFQKLIYQRFEIIDSDVRDIWINWHIVNSLQYLFPNRSEDFVAVNDGVDFGSYDIQDKVNGIGLCVLDSEYNSVAFVHRCYAEFFVAYWILGLSSIDSCQKHQLLRTQVLLEDVLNPVSLWGEEEIIVGRELPYIELTWLLCQQPISELIRDKWEHLMCSLNMTRQQVHEVRVQMAAFQQFQHRIDELQDYAQFLGNISLYVIREWTDKFTKPKPLSNFINASKLCGLNDLAVCMAKMYYRKDFAFGNIAFLINSGYSTITDGLSSWITIVGASRGLQSFIGQNMQTIIESCMRRDYMNLFAILKPIFNLYDQHTTPTIRCCQVKWSPVIEVACWFSSVDLISSVFETIETTTTNVPFCTNPERAQVKNLFTKLGYRGNFAVYAYMNQKLKPTKEELKDIIYACVSDTANTTDSNVETRIQIIKLILASHPTLLNGPLEDVSAMYALHAYNIDLKILEFLIDEGAYLGAMGTLGSNVAQNAAVFYPGDTLHKFCKLIIARGCSDIFIAEGLGSVTALHVVLMNMKVFPETVSLLLSNVQLNLRRHEIGYFIGALRGKKTAEILQQLVNAGANPMVRIAPTSHTTLHEAAKVGHIEGIKYFVSLGICVNSRDNKRRTPLHWAINPENPNIYSTVLALVDLNADVTLVDREHRTLHDYVRALATDVDMDQSNLLNLLKQLNCPDAVQNMCNLV